MSFRTIFYLSIYPLPILIDASIQYKKYNIQLKTEVPRGVTKALQLF